MEFDHNGMIYFALKEESGQVVHISEMVEKIEERRASVFVSVAVVRWLLNWGEEKGRHILHIWRKKEERHARQMQQMKADFIR